MYSYSLDFFNLDPMGSTNYGKLTNVSLYINPSAAAVAAASAVVGGVGGVSYVSACSVVIANGTLGATYQQQQTFEFVVTAVNNNIVRISGGALGFPVL